MPPFQFYKSILCRLYTAVFFIIVCVGMGCRSRTSSSDLKILNGSTLTDLVKSQYPYVGAIISVKNGKKYGGGGTATLIAPDIILTASHVLIPDADWHLFALVTDARKLSDSLDRSGLLNNKENFENPDSIASGFKSVRNIRKFERLNESWSFPVNEDIAIGRLSSSLPVSSVACLPKSKLERSVEGSILGFGMNNSNLESSGLLRKGVSRFVDYYEKIVSHVDLKKPKKNNELDRRVSYAMPKELVVRLVKDWKNESMPGFGPKYLVNSMVVVPAPDQKKQIICPGDSGGPFLVPGKSNTRIVHGIGSRSLGCKANESNDVISAIYAPIFHNVKWIKSKATEWGSSIECY